MERLIGTRGRLSHGSVVGVVAFFLGLAIGVTMMTAAQGQPMWVFVSRFVQNLAAAIAGALITLVLIERTLLRRMVSETKTLSDELIGLLREEGDEAVQAADMLAMAGQFRSGSMRGENLTGAQLAGRNLSRADFRNTRLRAATLHDADLRKAQLNHADLSLADLRRANLSGANLAGARLWMAYLHGADLHKAHINGHELCEAYSLRGTIMPDGTRYDGQYALAGDIEAAAESGIDVTDPMEMSNWYATCSTADAVLAEEDWDY